MYLLSYAALSQLKLFVHFSNITPALLVWKLVLLFNALCSTKHSTLISFVEQKWKWLSQESCNMCRTTLCHCINFHWAPVTAKYWSRHKGSSGELEWQVSYPLHDNIFFKYRLENLISQVFSGISSWVLKVGYSTLFSTILESFSYDRNRISLFQCEVLVENSLLRTDILFQASKTLWLTIKCLKCCISDWIICVVKYTHTWQKEIVKWDVKSSTQGVSFECKQEEAEWLK